MLLLIVQVINFNFEEFVFVFFPKVVFWVYRRWLGMLTQTQFNG